MNEKYQIDKSKEQQRFEAILLNVAENMCLDTGAELQEDGSILYTGDLDGEALSPEQVEQVLTSDRPRENLYKFVDGASFDNDGFLWNAAAEAIAFLSDDDSVFLDEYIQKNYTNFSEKIDVFRDMHPFDFEFNVDCFLKQEIKMDILFHPDWKELGKDEQYADADLVFLAKQQGIEKEFRQAMADGSIDWENIRWQDSSIPLAWRFVEENDYGGTLTILSNMKLGEAIDILEAQQKEAAEGNVHFSIQLPNDATVGRYDFTGCSAPGFYIDNLPKPIVLPIKDITLHNDEACVSPRFSFSIGEEYNSHAWDAKATIVKTKTEKRKTKTQAIPCR